ncbi:MAG: hypothetical protein K6F74_03380 [Prevotella sp.]|nr:hypothetical protein [Prevotella sp.]
MIIAENDRFIQQAAMESDSFFFKAGLNFLTAKHCPLDYQAPPVYNHRVFTFSSSSDLSPAGRPDVFPFSL